MPKSASAVARSERLALCDLFEELGADAPTLCEGWTNQDLAAHLVIREYRPDASLGIVVKQASVWTDRVQNGAAEQPFEDLVEQVRNGPPFYSPMSLPGLEGKVNLLEYFVHHEDVRRAQPDWEPRALDADTMNVVWDRLTKAARGLFMRSRVGVVLQRSDVDAKPVTAKGGEPSVTLVGDPAELTMLAFGRREHRVQVQGDSEAVETFKLTQRCTAGPPLRGPHQWGPHRSDPVAPVGQPP
jgi:uncharacterized protein (TIGR03085 family)